MSAGRVRVLPLIVLSLLMLTVASPAFANPPVFGDPTFYKASGGPRAIVNADFDNDGDLDIANTNFFNSGTDDVTVFLNDDDGTYGAATGFDAIAGVQGIAAGNLNSDGNVDLVVTDQGDGPGGAEERFAVLTGNGDGTFDAPVVYGSGGDNAIDAGIGDFDGDTDQDIAIVNQDSDNVTIFENTGVNSGTFSAEPVQTLTAGDAPTAVATGNLDSGSDPDLAVANSGDGDVSVFTGGTGSAFTKGADVPADDGTIDVALADFDDDGSQDLVTANNGAAGDEGNISVALGNGDGTFDASTEYDANEGPFSVTTGDYDLDGNVDVAVANQFTRSGGGANNDKGDVSAFTGKGDGTFNAQVVFDAGDGPVGLTTGDFNDDDKPDLATANFGGGAPEEEIDTISVLLNNTVAGTGDCDIIGTQGNDRLNGTSEGETICGLGGNDTINGLDGDDTIRGGNGDDRAVGGVGNDRISGDNGNDRILGGPGMDRLAGGAGSDNIQGDGSTDTLDGDNGNDILRGGDGTDTLRGDAGNDTLASNTGRGDSLNGGVGNDSLNVRDGAGNDRADGSAGRDTCGRDAGDTVVRCEVSDRSAPLQK